MSRLEPNLTKTNRSLSPLLGPAKRSWLTRHPHRHKRIYLLLLALCWLLADSVGLQCSALKLQETGGGGKESTPAKKIHLLKVIGQQRPNVKRNPDADGPLQVSITPRVGLVRVPVESNAILKCLISAQSNKFTRKFDIHWSRFMYDENVYEQLESSTYLTDDEPAVTSSSANTTFVHNGSSAERSAKLLQVSEQTGKQPSDQEEAFKRLLAASLPFNRQQQLRDFLARSRQESNQISELLIEASLLINPVKASDNATYFCTASDPQTGGQNEARIDLLTLSRPVVQLERVQPSRDSRSALVHWLVLSNGNTPIKKTILMVRNGTALQTGLNESAGGQLVTDSDLSQWQRIDIQGDGEQDSSADERTRPGGPSSPQAYSDDSVVRADLDGSASSTSTDVGPPPNNRWRLNSLRRQRRAYNLSSLQPGATYTLRLAALNDMGQSTWTYLTATMPNEIPAQIADVFLLSRSNDSLAIGWRRPSWDGAKTLRYEMQLFDLNRTLTLDASTATGNSSGQARTNFMYIFVGLNPGTDYHFHVRACSRAGCSAYSAPKLLASTLDGEPEEPLDVELTCQLEPGGRVQVSWLPPASARGQLLNYTVTFDAYAKFLNQSGRWMVEEWRSSLDTADNHTLSVETGGLLVPNTNYTVRVCANNRSRHCGRPSAVSARNQCSTPPRLPERLPAGLHLEKRLESRGAESLVLELPQISMRNGTIDCVQVVLIRLPRSFQANASQLSQYLPEHPSEIRLAGQSMAELRSMFAKEPAVADQQKALAYLAEEIDQLSWPAEQHQVEEAKQQVVLGDGSQQVCQSLRLLQAAEPVQQRPQVFDGALRPRTHYTGFVRLLLVAPGEPAKPKILVKYSDYFNLVQTSERVLEVGGPDELLDGPQASESANKTSKFREMAARLGSSLDRSWRKLYNDTSTFLNQNVRLDQLSRFIMSSSPLMQLLEVGILVLSLSLLLLGLIYLITLPAAARRKRRAKLKKRLARAEANAAEQKQPVEQPTGIYLRPSLKQPSTAYQDAYVVTECPIHSSPSVAGPGELQLVQPIYHSHHLAHQEQHYQQQQQQQQQQLDLERNCRTLRSRSHKPVTEETQPSGPEQNESPGEGRKTMTLSQPNSVLSIAKRLNKSIPLRLFRAVFELRLRQAWLKEEYEQLPREQLQKAPAEGGQLLSLRPQLVVSRNDTVSALISGNQHFDASLIRWTPTGPNGTSPLASAEQRRLICARSPLDADSVWDFWRLVYERDVATIVMLSQTEDASTGELRCAQYWPTCDNEETTILSPCNEYVQKSDILPAKFKIRQETLEAESLEDDWFKVRRLTLLVMATRPDENAAEETNHDNKSSFDSQRCQRDQDDDEEELVIVERTILHLQFFYWNTSNQRNQSRLVRFIQLANEKHRRWGSRPKTADGSPGVAQLGPLLVHCYNGLGRSGLFTAMSFVIDELNLKLQLERRLQQLQQQNFAAAKENQVQKVNLYQMVWRLRSQREMLLSPYRLYELLYLLTSNCIPQAIQE